MEIRDIKLEKDEREENLIKNEAGEVIGFKQSEYTCKIYLPNDSWFVIENPDIEKVLKLIAENEDYKYPYGMGRTMILLKHIYPIFKEYLDSHGFTPNPKDLEKAQRKWK